MKCDELVALCTFNWSWEAVRKLAGTSIWEAFVFQLFFWDAMRILPLFCLALTFSSCCAAFASGFTTGASLAFVLFSPLLPTTSEAIAVVRRWWHDFSKNPVGWRRMLGNSWGALCDNVSQGTPTASPDRLCLCVGISEYMHARDFKPLAKSALDALAVADAFSALGYTCCVVTNAGDKADLDRQVEDFISNGVAQSDDRSGSTMTVVIYFAGHGLELQGGLHLCMADAKIQERATSEAFVQAAGFMRGFVKAILKKAGSSRKLACLGLWDCCRYHDGYTLGTAPLSGMRDPGTRKHQIAEIRACGFDRFAQDGVFAAALCHYLRCNEAYSIQELYEHVNVAVMRETNNRQMCELKCESSELTQRVDFFVTPTKWAEQCSRLEDLKPTETHEDSSADPNESAFFTENLELREEAQRQEEAIQQLRERLTQAGTDDTRAPGDSLSRRLIFTSLQLLGLCSCSWTLWMFLSLPAADATGHLTEELQNAQAQVALLKAQTRSWFTGCCVATSAALLALIYVRRLNADGTSLALQVEKMSQQLEEE